MDDADVHTANITCDNNVQNADCDALGMRNIPKIKKEKKKKKRTRRAKPIRLTCVPNLLTVALI